MSAPQARSCGRQSWHDVPTAANCLFGDAATLLPPDMFEHHKSVSVGYWRRRPPAGWLLLAGRQWPMYFLLRGVGWVTSGCRPCSQGARGAAGCPAGAAARRAVRRQGQHRRRGLPHHRRLQGLRLQPRRQRARCAAAARGRWARKLHVKAMCLTLRAVEAVLAALSHTVVQQLLAAAGPM
jgi:hypothetical protein